jgi:tetratricopeptide (TPR) repeat protein
MDMKISIKYGRLLIIILFISLLAFNAMYYYMIKVEENRLLKQDNTFKEIQSMLFGEKYEDAIKLLNRDYPADKYGASDVIWFLRGRAFFGKKDYKMAEAMFKKALAVNPLMLRSYDFLYYYSLSLNALGDKVNASKIIKAALVISPRHLSNSELKRILQEIEDEKG